MSWEDDNNAYLAQRLDDLRRRLVALAPAPALPPVLPETPPPPHGRRWFRRRAPEPVRSPLAETPDLPFGAAPATASAPVTPTGDDAPALVVLGDRLGLTPFERDVLLLAAAPELDPAAGPLCAAAQGASGPAAPTFGLALRLFDAPEWEALAPHRPLRRRNLVTLSGGEGAVHARLRADERVVNLLKGLDHLDERLVELLVPLAAGPPDQPIDDSQAQLAARILRRVRAAGSSRIVVSLTGTQAVSKRILAQRVAAELGAHAVRLPVANLPPPGAELALLTRLWERDSLLSPLALYLDAFDAAGDLPHDATAVARRLLARVNGLVFVDSREAWAGLDGAALVVEVPNPTAAEQQSAWEAALPATQRDAGAELAAHFDLDALAIRDLAATTQSGDDGDPRALWDEVRISQRPSLDLLGRRAQTVVAPETLVVPDDVLEQLERIEEQVRQRARVYNHWGLASRMSRGLGISALFAGESGTGKTLAAEVIAASLGLDLYRIDLSGVVSKYIGETEKNLRRVFDAAERGGTILCFDEADALFGRRSEVRDSHDRYANIEVNYLLQRMEEYRGLAILTTNMKTALDHAFTRRIRFIVTFPFPGAADRERLWRGAFLPGLDTSGLDYARLAQLTLAGGGIHNVAVNATFGAAAASGNVVTMPMVLAAARLEYRKNDLPVNEAAFAWDERPPARLEAPAPTP
jgi:hypothetical protein